LHLKDVEVKGRPCTSLSNMTQRITKMLICKVRCRCMVFVCRKNRGHW